MIPVTKNDDDDVTCDDANAMTTEYQEISKNLDKSLFDQLFLFSKFGLNFFVQQPTIAVPRKNRSISSSKFFLYDRHFYRKPKPIETVFSVFATNAKK